MLYTLKNGDRFEVVIVHSSHDVKNSEDEPGGYRQLVNSLARSLHRRVTFAEVIAHPPDIAEAPVLGLYKLIYPEIFESLPLGQGWALCNLGDTFTKKFGRELAVLRALRISRLSREERNELGLLAVGISYDELQKLYARPGVTNTTTMPDTPDDDELIRVRSAGVSNNAPSGVLSSDNLARYGAESYGEDNWRVPSGNPFGIPGVGESVKIKTNQPVTLAGSAKTEPRDIFKVTPGHGASSGEPVLSNTKPSDIYRYSGD